MKQLYSSRNKMSRKTKGFYGPSHIGLTTGLKTQHVGKLYGSVDGKTKVIARFLKSDVGEAPDYPTYELEAVPVYDDPNNAYFVFGAQYDIYVRKKIGTVSGPTTGWYIYFEIAPPADSDRHFTAVRYVVPPEGKAPEDFGEEPVARICFYFGAEPQLTVHAELRLGTSPTEGSQIVLGSTSGDTEPAPNIKALTTEYWMSPVPVTQSRCSTLIGLYVPILGTDKGYTVPDCVLNAHLGIETECIITDPATKEEIYHKTNGLVPIDLPETTNPNRSTGRVAIGLVYPVKQNYTYNAVIHWTSPFPEAIEAGVGTITISFEVKTRTKWTEDTSHKFATWQRDKVDYDFELPVTEDFELDGTWDTFHAVNFWDALLDERPYLASGTQMPNEITWVADGAHFVPPEIRQEEHNNAPYENDTWVFKNWVSGVDGHVWDSTTDIVTETMTLYAVYEHKVSSIKQLYYMQDFAKLSLAEYEQVKASMTVDEPYVLYDIRDGTAYRIALMKDDRIWMIDELRLMNCTLTPKDSDVAENYVLPENKLNFNSNTPALYQIETGEVFYNYYCLTAGSVPIPADDTESRQVDAPYSIAPKGWRIPSQDYDALAKTCNNNISVLTAMPYNFKKIGICVNDRYLPVWTPNNWPQAGFYQEIMQRNRESNHGVCITDYYYGDANYINIWAGALVRCLVKEPKE